MAEAGLSSGGVTQAGQEGIDALKQRRRVLAELAGGIEDVVGERAGLVSGMACAGDIVRNLLGAGGGLLHASRNLARRRTLLLDGGRNGGGDAADLPDGVADATDRADAIAGGGLDRADLARDLFSGLGGLT